MAKSISNVQIDERQRFIDHLRIDTVADRARRDPELLIDEI